MHRSPLCRAALLLPALALLLGPHLLGAVVPDAFDAPWIGYSTAVYPEGLEPVDAVVADFDGDGVADLATVSWGGTAHLSILLAAGDGAYAEAVTYPLQEESLGVVAADFDSDGDIDLVTTDTGRFWEGFTVSLWRNDGSGAFSFAGQSDAGNSGPSGIAVADFDGDGLPDVAVAHDRYIVTGETMAVLLNVGGGAFQVQQVLTTQAGTNEIAAGDVDGDGLADVVLGNETNRFVVLRNQGGGTMVEVAVVDGVPAGFFDDEVGITLADLDLDLDLDVVFSNGDTGDQFATSLGVWRNTGDGTFGPAEELGLTGSFRGGVEHAAADVTGDGWPDLLVAADVADDWFLIPGDGAGGFEAARRFRAGERPVAVFGPDLDSDGDLDVVVLAASSLEAAVYLNPGDGSFVQPALIDMTPPSISPAFAVNLEAGDIDRDGDLDLVTGYRADFAGQDGLSVRRNLGDGSFDPVEAYPDTIHPLHLRLADIDGDGDLDVTWIDGNSHLKHRDNLGDGSFGAIVDEGLFLGASTFDFADVDADGDLDAVVATGFTADVALNDGFGDFGPPIASEVDDFFDAVGLGDFDGDGSPDLLTNSGLQGFAQVSSGNGDGTFASPNTVTTGRDVHDFATGDVDGDNAVDFVATTSLDARGSLSVRRGRGEGNFFPLEERAGSYHTSELRGEVLLADADGDLDLDALAANFGAQDISLWRGDGTGGFSAVERYGVGQPAQDLEVADFDGDGVVDAAVLTEADTGTASYPAVILLRGLGEGPALDLALGELVPGREATLTVTGAEAQETVQVAGSAAGIGPGPCPPALGGLCLDLLEPRLVGSAEADGAGTAVVTFVVPAGAPVGATLHFQAVAVRGPGGVDSVKSAPASGPVVAP